MPIGKVLNLKKDDLFLTYHEAVGDEPAYYTAEVQVNDTVVTETVTEVAADENIPYHDMYAVWEKLPEIEITKYIIDTTTPLKGATFSFSGGEYASNKELTLDSDATGKLVYGEKKTKIAVEFDVEYTLRETNVLDGYIGWTGDVTIKLERRTVYNEATDENIEEYVLIYSNTNAYLSRNTQISNNHDTVYSDEVIYDNIDEIYQVPVYNAPGVSLPSTGGIGSRTVTYAGAAVLLLTAAAFVWRRRKIEEN